MKILHVDSNHPLLIEELQALDFQNDEAYTATKEAIEQVIGGYDGLVIRSRFPVDQAFLEKATNLKFIARVGAGMENIDEAFAKKRGILLFNAPEGNRNAVGEHALGMLLSLFNKMNKAHKQVKKGIWDREGNRGVELDGKTVGIIGYGNTGKAFARKLKGFDVEVYCYDIVGGVGDDHARQVGILEFKKNVDVVSLHIPQTPETIGLVNTEFIESFTKPFWLLNTARGSAVVTKDLVKALKAGKVLGAGLDVLEYEKASFENFFDKSEADRSSVLSRLKSKPKKPKPLKYLLKADNVLITPHVAGWTKESKEKLAQTIVHKIKASFC